MTLSPDRQRDVDVDIGSRGDHSITVVRFALPGRLGGCCCRLLECLLGFTVPLGPFLLQLGFRLEDVPRHGQISLADSVEEPHFRSAFGLGRRQAVVNELGLVPMGRPVFGAVGTVKDGLELREGRATVPIVASLDMELARVRPAIARHRGSKRHVCGCKSQVPGR